MAETDKSEWILIDADLSTRLKILPVISAHMLLELNNPGSGDVRIPLDTESAGVITSGMFIAGYYRGAYRAGIFVENIKADQVNSNENGGRMMAISGAGAADLLADAIVFSSGTESTRDFTGMTKAAILIDMIEEAQARGCFPSLTWDFDDTDDSDSNAWDDSEDIQLTVGDSLLDVAQMFAAVGGFDFDMRWESGGFVLSVYKNGIGENKPTAIFRAGANCTEITEDERGDDALANVLLTKYGDGYAIVKDDASITAYRRREKILNAELAQSLASATTYAAAKLQESKQPRNSITIQAHDGRKPYVFLDYVLGDTVPYDVKGVVNSHRIKGLQLDFANDDFAASTLDLNDIFYENNLERAGQLDWLLRQWNTARDGNLLEVRSWVALGLPTDDAAPGDAYMDGDFLYICGDIVKVGGLANANINARYNMVSGEWFPIVGLGFEECVIHVGDWTYFGFTASTTIAYRVHDDGVTPSEIYLSGGSPSNTYDFETDGTYLYTAGNFGNEYGANTQGIFKTHLGTDVSSAIGSGLNEPVYSLYWDGANLFAGTADAVHMWNGSTWTEISSGGGIDGPVYAIVKAGNTLYVGGDFTGFFAVWDNVDTFTAISGVNGIVNSLTSYLSDVYLGGEFTEHVRRYSGGVFVSLEGGTSGDVNAVVMHESTLIAVGDYVSAGVVSAIGVAAYFTSFEALNNVRSNSFDLGNAIHNATAVTSATSADEFPLWDSATELLRKITFNNLWLSIKALADTFYVALTGDQTVAGIKRFSDSIQIGVAPPVAEADGGMSQGAEGASVGNLLWTWGTSVSSFITGLRARGTKASPTAAQANDDGLRLGARFHDDSTYGNTSARIKLTAAETHSSSAHGTKILLETTPLGSTTINPTPPSVTPDGDMEFPVDTTGVILKDRDTGDLYRLYVDAGVLQIEAV
jgi:hypothetical protein